MCSYFILEIFDVFEIPYEHVSFVGFLCQSGRERQTDCGYECPHEHIGQALYGSLSHGIFTERLDDPQDEDAADWTHPTDVTVQGTL